MVGVPRDFYYLGYLQPFALPRAVPTESRLDPVIRSYLQNLVVENEGARRQPPFRIDSRNQGEAFHPYTN